MSQNGTWTRRLNIFINGKEVRNDIASIKNEMFKLISTQSRMTIGSKEYVKAGTEIKKLNGIIAEHNASLRNTSSTTDKLITQFKGLLPALGVGAVVGFFANIGKQIFAAQEKFQTFNAVLKTALGSKGAAASSLQMIQDFAAKTPFSVEQLTNSFIKLVNRGFKPTKEELTKMGDLASTSGKDFDMLVEAILDAETGEFERLKEFGIKAKVSGEQVTMTFKGVKTSVDNNAESIRTYLLGLGELDGVMGSMSAISDTLAGKTSNLGDAWDTLMKTMGDSSGGIFSSVISGLTSIINFATLAAKSIKQIKLENEISNASENVKESMQEIEIVTASLVKNNTEMNEAKKIAYDLYKSSRNTQIKDLDLEISKTQELMKVSKLGKLYVLKKREEELMSRKNMLLDEMEQIRTLKDVQNSYSSDVTNYSKLSIKELNALVKKGDQLAKAELVTRKSLSDGLKDSFQELSKQISDFDIKINNAITSGNLPLAKKFSEEQHAMELLLATYKEVKNQIEKGWSFPGKEMGPQTWEIENGVDPMNPKVYNSVSPLKAQNSPLKKRKTGLEEDTPEERGAALMQRLADEEKQAKEIKDAYTEMEWQSAQTLNDTIFTIVRNRQQAEFDQAINLLEKKRQAELDNKNLTESQIAAINEKYDKKQATIKAKQFKKEQNAAATMAFINGALAITKTFTSVPFPLNIPLAIGQGVATAAQIAIIKSEEVPEFFAGGYTTNSANNNKAAGIVHANEYVIPATGLSNQHLSPFINLIEMARLNGNLASINPSLHGLSLSDSQYQRSVFNAQYSTEKMGIDTEIINANTIVLEALLHKLSQPLNVAPVEATVSLLGRNGILENTEKYENMKGKSSL